MISLATPVASQSIPIDSSKPFCAPAVKTACTPGQQPEAPNPLKRYVNSWPTLTIPVAFSPKVNQDQPLRNAVIRSLRHIRDTTGLNFSICTPRPQDTFEYLYFEDRDSCFTYNVGWKKGTFLSPSGQVENRKMEVAIGSGADTGIDGFCDQDFPGGIVHEVLHALGSDHAHWHDGMGKRGREILIRNKRLMKADPKPDIKTYRMEFVQLRLKDYDYHSLSHYSCNLVDKGPLFDVFAIGMKQRLGITPFYDPSITGPNGYCREWSGTTQILGSDVGQEFCISKGDADFFETVYFDPLAPTSCDAFNLRSNPSCSPLN